MPGSAVANALSLAVFGLAAAIATAPVWAQGLVTTHRLSAAVANELVSGAVAACKEKTYNVTAVVLDIDGVRQALLRGDGAGIATLEVANDKAFTSISTRTDTGVLVERAKTTTPSQFILKVPHMLLLQGESSSKSAKRQSALLASVAHPAVKRTKPAPAPPSTRSPAS